MESPRLGGVRSPSSSMRSRKESCLREYHETAQGRLLPGSDTGSSVLEFFGQRSQIVGMVFFENPRATILPQSRLSPACRLLRRSERFRCVDSQRDRAGYEEPGT